MPDHTPPNPKARFTGCLLGLATGDAVDCAPGFVLRGNPDRSHPAVWTDITAMAVCLAESLVSSSDFNPADQMRRYLRWRMEGLLTSSDAVFDVRNQVNAALMRYSQNGDPYSGDTADQPAGSGSTARLAPVVMWAFPNLPAVLRLTADSSRTTHGATACVEACQLLGGVLTRALQGLPQDKVLIGDDPASKVNFQDERIAAIARGSYLEKGTGEMAGTEGVAASLEAALWSFATTDSFESAVLKAATFDRDTDNAATICGQIAGAHYGIDSIPAHWLDQILLREKIEDLACQLMTSSPDLPPTP